MLFLSFYFSFNRILFVQVFVANPNKAQPIQDILLKNKDRLVEFLTQFHTDRTGKVVHISAISVHLNY